MTSFTCFWPSALTRFALSPAMESPLALKATTDGIVGRPRGAPGLAWRAAHDSWAKCRHRNESKPMKIPWKSMENPWKIHGKSMKIHGNPWKSMEIHENRKSHVTMWTSNEPSWWCWDFHQPNFGAAVFQLGLVVGSPQIDHLRGGRQQQNSLCPHPSQQTVPPRSFKNGTKRMTQHKQKNCIQALWFQSVKWLFYVVFKRTKYVWKCVPQCSAIKIAETQWMSRLLRPQRSSGTSSRGPKAGKCKYWHLVTEALRLLRKKAAWSAWKPLKIWLVSRQSCHAQRHATRSEHNLRRKALATSVATTDSTKLKFSESKAQLEKICQPPFGSSLQPGIAAVYEQFVLGDAVTPVVSRCFKAKVRITKLLQAMAKIINIHQHIAE